MDFKFIDNINKGDYYYFLRFTMYLFFFHEALKKCIVMYDKINYILL